jgi:hypothetical protein
MAIKLSRRRSGATSRIVIPPREAADENTAWLVSMSMMSLYFVTDQYGPNMLSLQ